MIRLNRKTGGGGGGSIVSPLNWRVIMFYEDFVGDGIETEFQLTSNIANGVFGVGSWGAFNIKNTLPGYVTKTNNNKAYDGIVIGVRNVITVLSISAGGLVTTSHPPRSGQTVRIWYWYELAQTDRLDDYIREDFVTDTETDHSDVQSKLDLKTDKVNPVVAGNVAELDSNGNLVDSGKAKTLLNVFTGLLPGIVPASGGDIGKYLRADSTFVTPPGISGVAPSYLAINDSTRSDIYTVLGSSFIYGGTDFVEPITDVIALYLKDVDPNTMDIRLYDMTNSNVIAEVTGLSASTATQQSLGTVSNLPTGSSIFELQVRRVGNPNDTDCIVNSVQLNYT